MENEDTESNDTIRKRGLSITKTVKDLKLIRHKSFPSNEIVESGKETTFSLRDELNKILQNEQECFMFKIYLKTRRCEENLCFVLDVQSFKNTELTPDDMLEDKSRAIIARYLDDESVEKVNLDASDVNTIINSPVTRDLFDAAEEHILRLLETSCVLKYKESEADSSSDTSKRRHSRTVSSYFMKDSYNEQPSRTKSSGTIKLDRLFSLRLKR